MIYFPDIVHTRLIKNRIFQARNHSKAGISMKIVADTATLFPPARGSEMGMTIIPVCVCINNKTYKDYEEHWPGENKERHCTFVVDDLTTVTDPLTKLVMVGDFDSFAMKEELLPIFGDELTFLCSGKTFLDIMKKGTDKGSGIRYFRALWGLTREECMSFGDEYNDLEQFDESEWSFAMGNASDYIKSRANYVTDTNENDGVTKAIRKYVLHEDEA